MDFQKDAVVFMAHCYPSGLIYHWAHLAGELALAHQKNKFDFFICSHVEEQYKGSWDLLRQRVPEKQIMTVTDYDLGVYQVVKTLLENHPKVIVHYGGGHNLLKPLKRIKKEFGKRLIVIAITQSYRHDHWLRIPVSTYQFLLYKKYVDYVVFQCPYAARRFVGGGWFLDNNRGGYIPLGVESFSEEQMTIRPEEVVGNPDIRDLLEEKDWFNFVYLAEVRPGKGQHWLLDALRPVLQNNPKARMFFLGGGGSLFDALRSKVKKYGLEKQVICPGTVARKFVPWILAHCHAALIPTRAETFGHCFSEPAMAGIPILGTRVGVGEYLIQDMLTGIGFTYGNTDCIRESAQFFVTHKEDVKKMGETLKESVKNEFLHTKVANAYMLLYERLLAK